MKNSLFNLKFDYIHEVHQIEKVKYNHKDSGKSFNKVNFKKTLDYIKYNKLFLELYKSKTLNKSIKGIIINSIKGGFSVAIAGLITFISVFFVFIL